jgi:hypothetical protein
VAVAWIKEKLGTGKYTLLILFLVGFIHGCLYLFMVPPWQHYDEPGNFEYAWLVSNQPSWPQPGDYDPEMRRETFASLVENHFFELQGISGYPSLLTDLDKPAWLGISQLGDWSIYYLLASIPLRFIQYTDITFQLYVARFVSLALFLLTLFAAWGAMGELLSDPHHPLRWMVPASMALLPGFVDLMTAVNNDVAAITFFTLFLWGCIRLIKKGLTPVNCIWVLATTTLCVFTKSTVYIAIPLAGLAFLFGMLRGHRRKYAWISIALVAVAGLGFTFTWGDMPAYFYVSNGLTSSVRVQNLQAPVGKFAFELDVVKENDTAQINQPILPSTLSNLAGKEVTIGGWFWADHPVEIILPQILAPHTQVGQIVSVGLDEKPQFFAYTVQMPSNPQLGWLIESPTTKNLSSPTSIFIDGLVLAEGNFPADNPPVFYDSSGSSGIWVGQEFQNLVQNGTAESGWPGFRPWVENIFSKYFPINPTFVWATLDWKWSIPYFKGDLMVLFRSFWARFGWGNVSLAGKRPYRVLVIATIIGLIGAVVLFGKNKRQLNIGLFSFGLVALAGIWGITLLRGIGSIFNHTLYPVSRYAYPSMLITIGVLDGGWFTVLDYGLKYMRLPRKVLTFVFILLFLGFDVFALYSLHLYITQH